MASSSSGKPDMPLISAGKPDNPDDETMSAISAAKPDMTCLFAFYNITWSNSRFNKPKKHERTPAADIRAALDEYNTDVLLLSECGKVDQGLAANLWLPMLRRICGPGFDVKHQGHYTSIVRLSTVNITAEPSLQGPLTTWPNHAYRMCQHLQVNLKGSVGKPIDLYNCHSPASKKNIL